MPSAMSSFSWAATATSSGGASFDDSSASNRVLAVVAVLVAVAVLVLVFTVWFWRTTRPEPGALAPLELLGTRRLRRADPERRRRELDAARPPTASVAAPSDMAPLGDAELASLAKRDLPALGELEQDVLEPVADPVVVAAPLPEVTPLPELTSPPVDGAWEEPAAGPSMTSSDAEPGG